MKKHPSKLHCFNFRVNHTAKRWSSDGSAYALINIRRNLECWGFFFFFFNQLSSLHSLNAWLGKECDYGLWVTPLDEGHCVLAIPPCLRETAERERLTAGHCTRREKTDDCVIRLWTHPLPPSATFFFLFHSFLSCLPLSLFSSRMSAN